MRIDRYLQHIPEIERRLRLLQPDAIVYGLGPSAWLMPWVDQSLLQGVRRFGVNDIFRLTAVEDLIVMDQPIGPLHPDNERFAVIAGSRPRRLWIYTDAWITPPEVLKKRPYLEGYEWKAHLPAPLHSIVRLVPWRVFPPGVPCSKFDFRLAVDPPQTTSVSPVGAMTLAWNQGCRRIGVIGMDMMQGHHHSHDHVQLVDLFCKRLAMEARDLGGALVNLSPISAITRLPCEPLTSGSEPTKDSDEPVQSECLSTASASTLAAT